MVGRARAGDMTGWGQGGAGRAGGGEGWWWEGLGVGRAGWSSEIGRYI